MNKKLDSSRSHDNAVERMEESCEWRIHGGLKRGGKKHGEGFPTPERQEQIDQRKKRTKKFKIHTAVSKSR